MGTIVAGVLRCACLLRKVVSTFGPTPRTLSNGPNTLLKELERLNLSKVGSKPNRTRNLKQSIKSRENHILQTVDCAHASINFSTSYILQSFNEPLRPVEGNVPDTFCWNCKEDFGSDAEVDQLHNLLTCSNCNVLRRVPANINYFELFGIERIFKMDLKKLAQKYKSMQRILHPDR